MGRRSDIMIKCASLSLIIHSSNSQLFKMDKIKKKLNNSASLGKTIARGPQPHSKSFFVEPTDFVVTSQQKESSVKRNNEKSGSTSKVSSAKAPVTKNISVAESFSRIQQNRKYCTKAGVDLQSSMIEKSMRVNRLMKQLHHFSICVEELRWLLNEGDKLIQGHFKQTQLIAPESSYTQDVSDLAKEFRSLVLRFGSIDKINFKNIEDFLKNEKEYRQEMSDTVGFSSLEDTRIVKPNRKLNSLADSVAFLKEKEETRDNSFVFPKNFSVPLKENVNKSNLSVHFENIKLLPPKQAKQRAMEVTCNPLQGSLRKSLQQQLQRQKQELCSKLRRQQSLNQELSGKIGFLNDELSAKQSKISKYRVFSTRSVEQLGDILKRLVSNLSKSDREFELLKMAQCLSTWEKMLEEQLEDRHFHKLYLDSNAMSLERTQKLEEIIGLQYEINNLLGQRKHLQLQQNLNKSGTLNQHMEEYYRMLQVQAISLQELCGQ